MPSSKDKDKNATRNATPSVDRRTLRNTYDVKYCKMLKEHMAEGLSMEAFAGKIGKHRDTLYEWMRQHPEFMEAKKVGLEASLLFWEKILRAQAGGKLKGNAASAIFVMKNRFGWRDTQALEVTGRNGGPVQYQDLTPEEQQKKAIAGLNRLINALSD